ncbi:MAG TPA: MarR family transcriptional regulator [Parvularculaceae bacterium]|mgnify:CR=1 FL=1|nr:MarR family transcriptional regulator [Parvularculaceae bacterium]HNS85707.1 MarR family transcriptional regulator [Parvularculaceae bacterium]
MAIKKNAQSRIGPSESGFDLESYLLYNLVRTAATYNEEMASALKRYRLDTMKWRILMLLNDKSPSSVGELARRSVTKMPTLTRVLIRMEDEGLIVRQAQVDDKRVVQVTMTPKAVTTLKAVQQIGQRVFERAIEGLDEVEIAQITATLKRMRANLSRSPYDASEPTTALKRAKAS